MKKFLVLALVAMFSVTGFSKTIDEIFNAFPKADNVQEMTIDKKAILAMAMDSGWERANQMKNIDSMRIFAIDDATAEQVDIANELMNDGVDGFDVLIDADDDGEQALILTQSEGDVINKMLIFGISKDEVAIIFIEGKLNPDDASKMIHLGK
ncbi:MAG: DUF4252 domain-containing protein [Muribaculaceae bacterium]|nr:DUF4252 domain-containing protein [Muribaculaceae bacterium]